MDAHAEIATDQLALADHLVETVEQELQVFLMAAQVHALLAVAEATREAAGLLMPQQHVRAATA